MNVVKEIERINKREIENGIYGGVTKGSWHDKYEHSAWVYIGGLSYELSEGDIICVMSQWGEIEDINLIRDKETNKSMGFAFLKYENQKSTILAVDNFNGISVLGRILRCDHVEQYKLPKDIREREEEKLEENPFLDVIIGPGHAYQNKEMENDFSITKGEDLWSQERDSTYKETETLSEMKHKKSKKKEKSKKRHKSDKYDTRSYEYNPQNEEKQPVEKFSKVVVPSVPQPVIGSDSGAVASWRGTRDPTIGASKTQFARAIPTAAVPRHFLSSL